MQAYRWHDINHSWRCRIAVYSTALERRQARKGLESSNLSASAGMYRYLYIGLILTAISAATFFIYKTSLPTSPEAEFGGVSLRIEYATSTEAQESGLGGRENIPDDYGMLFVFPEDGVYGFWMKDMLVSIDIFWLDSKGRVVSIAREVATSTYPNVFYPSTAARYVLETVSGFALEHSIATGTPLLLKNSRHVSK